MIVYAKTFRTNKKYAKIEQNKKNKEVKLSLLTCPCPFYSKRGEK